MLKKLRLDQTKQYEKYLALEEISKMLVSFVEGREHYLAIGAEQGDVDKWDDLVIQANNNCYIHVQAKRQATDFSSDSIKRDNYTKGKKENSPKDLSPFDEAIRSLGEYINKHSLKDLKKEFWLELPEGSTQIKAGLEIRHLRKLCELDIKSVTTLNDLIDLASKDLNTMNVYLWLTTWCDFIDWEHIFKCLKILKIRQSGLETDIYVRVENNLSRVFKTTEIKNVSRLILSYLDENATFAGAIKPRQLLYLLKDYLLPNVHRWTLFKNDGDGSYWNISGIHDLEDNNEIERPSIIVPALWSKDNKNGHYLKIDGKCVDDCLISESLMRLSIHPRGSFNVICSDKYSWENSIKTKIGGTLGVSKNDLCDLRILDGLEPFLQSEVKQLATITENESFAEKLHVEMYNNTFKFINRAIIDKIRVMQKGDIRDEIESRWNIWKQSLEINVYEQKKLFSQILHPKAEGRSVLGELRVGPKTVDLLSEAILLLLVVSVCLSDNDNSNWEYLTDELKMTAIGLAYWSGPSESSNKVIEIDDDDGIGKLLESEPGQIIIISQSNLSETEIYQDDITGEIRKSELLTHPNYPKLLITNNRNFKRNLKNGNIFKLKEYFRGSLDKYKNIIDHAVSIVVDEVME